MLRGKRGFACLASKRIGTLLLERGELLERAEREDFHFWTDFMSKIKAGVVGPAASAQTTRGFSPNFRRRSSRRSATTIRRPRARWHPATARRR